MKLVTLTGTRYPKNKTDCVDWKKLAGKKVFNKNVHLMHYGDIHPFENNPIFLAETLIVSDNSRLFIFYWINKTTFPNVKNLYLFNHPCEREVLRREFDNIYLTDIYERYVSYVNLTNNIKLVPFQKLGNLLKTFTPEELQLE